MKVPGYLEAASVAVLGLAWMAVLLWVPATVSIALAGATAVSWCLWLDRHPSA